MNFNNNFFKYTYHNNIDILQWLFHSEWELIGAMIFQN